MLALCHNHNTSSPMILVLKIYINSRPDNIDNMMSKIVSCFLCGVGGYQKGSEEFESHLMHDHGVVFDDGLDFMNKLSQFKTDNLKVPELTKKEKRNHQKGIVYSINSKITHFI